MEWLWIVLVVVVGWRIGKRIAHQPRVQEHSFRLVERWQRERDRSGETPRALRSLPRDDGWLREGRRRR